MPFSAVRKGDDTVAMYLDWFHDFNAGRRRWKFDGLFTALGLHLSLYLT